MLTHDTLTHATQPAESTLRRVLLTNATTSGLGGLAALVAGGPVADLLGVDRTGSVRLVGAGLMAFAAFVLWTATSPTARLRKEVPVISLGDAGWVVGTVVTISIGWYSTGGAVVMGIVGALVGALGAAQWTLAGRLGSDD